MPSAENKRIPPKVLEELFEKGNLGAADVGDIAKDHVRAL